VGPRQDIHGIDLEQAKPRDDALQPSAISGRGRPRIGEALRGQGDAACLGRRKDLLRLDRASPAVA
jgi:hypothetical protein